jgi:effector-binding domain-containing protein
MTESVTTTHTIVERAAQPYVGIRRTLPMASLSELADRLPDVFGWLGRRGVAPTDAPFFKYNVIAMAGELVVEAGVPVASAVPGDDEVISGVLPAGRFVTVTHTGHPDELLPVTADLLAWADSQGLTFDRYDSPAGDVWACRLEVYRTDPAQEPDMNKWETQLLFKLAD